MTEEVKKTTARRKAVKEDVAETAETVDEKVEEATEQVRELKDSDRILVMNNTTGIYGYYGINGYSFDLESYGQTIKIPLSELRIMASGQHRSHLTNAWLVILDDDVVEELNLTALYANIYTQEEVDRLLKNPTVLKDTFEGMVSSMKDVVIKRAKKLVELEELNDFRVIKAIEEVSKINITDI